MEESESDRVCSAVCVGGRRWLEEENRGEREREREGERHEEGERETVNAICSTRETEIVGEGRERRGRRKLGEETSERG